MRSLVFVALGALMTQAPPSLPVPSTDAPVLLDGRCEGDEWRRASRAPIRDGMELLLQQNASQLMLCVPLPPDSYGTMDLYVGSRTVPIPMNLHASAQVGERQRGVSGWPEWVFGNQRDWYSPPVALSRATVTDGKPRLTFGAVMAREVVIDKSKFGNGPWRLMIELRALGADKQGSAQFPAAATSDDPAGWAIVDVTP